MARPTNIVVEAEYHSGLPVQREFKREANAIRKKALYVQYPCEMSGWWLPTAVVVENCMVCYRGRYCTQYLGMREQLGLSMNWER